MSAVATLDIDQRVYVVRAPDGDYFRTWEGTEWETVKRFAHWSRDIRQAKQIKFGDLAKAGFIDLVCGFSGLQLVAL